MKISIDKLGWLVQVVSSKEDKTYKIIEMTGDHPNIESKIIADNISEEDAYENEPHINLHNQEISWGKYNL